MKRIGIMTDIETLGIGPRSVITQWAFIAFDLDDPDTIIKEVHEFLPIQPQFAFNRQVSGGTLIYWITHPEEAARMAFKANDGNDLDELLAVIRSVTRKVEQVIHDADDYEVWARGPQFDIVNIESLLEDIGEPAPWQYNKIMDLRTTMRAAGLASADVDNTGIIPHVALDDCRFQIRCYVEAMRQMRSRGTGHTSVPDFKAAADRLEADANA